MFNVQDLVAIVNLITNVINPEESDLCIADGNQDGIVNVNDIISFVEVTTGVTACSGTLPLFNYDDSVFTYCECFP